MRTLGSGSRNHEVLITLIALFYYLRSPRLSLLIVPGGGGGKELGVDATSRFP